MAPRPGCYQHPGRDLTTNRVGGATDDPTTIYHISVQVLAEAAYTAACAMNHNHGETRGDALRARARSYWQIAERADDRKTRLTNLLIAAHYLDRADELQLDEHRSDNVLQFPKPQA